MDSSTHHHDRGDARGGGPVLMATTTSRGSNSMIGPSASDRGRHRPNQRRRGQSGGDRPRPHSTRPNHRGDYNSMQPPMRLLTKPNDRGGLVTPGSVSIMQRESTVSSTGGSETPPQIISPETVGERGGERGLGGGSSTANHSTSNNHYNHHDGGVVGGGVKRITRRPTDGISSNASNYTPLQPSGRRIDRERSDGGGSGSAFTRVESSGFLSNVSNDTVTMKLINKSLMWEDKISEYMMEQSDFLVVGVLGKQGVGKSTVMSLLAGTRTGSGRPYLFKTQPKDVQESGGCTTAGVDIAITSERVILLDTQPILSEAILDDELIPSNTTRDSYLDVLSLQLAIFLFSVCHVVVVVMESGDFDVIFRFLWIAEKLKSLCCKNNEHMSDINDGPAPPEFFPQIVFLLNHATPDDYQPAALKELHSLLAENFAGAKVSVAGGISLARSGLVPVGKLIPPEHKEWSGIIKPGSEVQECNINLHLLPSNVNPQDSFGSYCVERYDREDAGLNPILSLIPMYQGHPSFQLLAETFRNQIFMMPRPSLCPTHNSTLSQQPQPMFERGWYDFAHRSWNAIKRSNLSLEHKKLLREMQQR